MSLDTALSDARSGLRRLDPAEAAAAQAGGAILVDTRPHAFRLAEGEIPGALVVERNVLEWRFAPDSEHRLPEARADAVVVVVCNEGYASSLAADSLRRLGVRNATDLDGGFRAWAAAGLPTVPGGTPALP
jgi:rhodanese-related sulfurtransferase